MKFFYKLNYKIKFAQSNLHRWRHYPFIFLYNENIVNKAHWQLRVSRAYDASSSSFIFIKIINIFTDLKTVLNFWISFIKKVIKYIFNKKIKQVKKELYGKKPKPNQKVTFFFYARIEKNKRLKRKFIVLIEGRCWSLKRFNNNKKTIFMNYCSSVNNKLYYSTFTQIWRRSNSPKLLYTIDITQIGPDPVFEKCTFNLNTRSQAYRILLYCDNKLTLIGINYKVSVLIVKTFKPVYRHKHIDGFIKINNEIIESQRSKRSCLKKTSVTFINNPREN